MDQQIKDLYAFILKYKYTVVEQFPYALLIQDEEISYLTYVSVYTGLEYKKAAK